MELHGAYFLRVLTFISYLFGVLTHATPVICLPNHGRCNDIRSVPDRVISLRNDIALLAMIYASRMNGTDIISYCDEGAIYHATKLIYNYGRRKPAARYRVYQSSRVSVTDAPEAISRILWVETEPEINWIPAG